jgi:aerobic-type carbon monoxide dehydrogenase small subunit (CoxS/CutS family)
MSLGVNGENHDLELDIRTTLLDALRELANALSIWDGNHVESLNGLSAIFSAFQHSIQESADPA